MPPLEALSADERSIVVADPRSHAVEKFHYPNGGAPVETISDGLTYGPTGVALSPAAPL